MYQLYRIGFPICLFTSQKYQHIGESLAGVEIKYDSKSASTGNLYFETHEKSRAEQAEWFESGILRNDNTWLWCIGDTEKLYLIGKKHLRLTYERNLDRVITTSFQFRETATSKGFTLSSDFVTKRLALKIIYCEQIDAYNMEKIA